jgi:hypothetical protein
VGDSVGDLLERVRQYDPGCFGPGLLVRSTRSLHDEAQVSWHRLKEQRPDLAAYGEGRLRSRVAYLATVDADGSPRVHPVTPIVMPERLMVFMEPTSPKGHDLRRGSRYALHCSVEDDEGGGGEFRVRGSARQIMDAGLRDQVAEHAPYEPSPAYVLFELLVDDAFSTEYDANGTPVRTRWQSGD